MGGRDVGGRRRTKGGFLLESEMQIGPLFIGWRCIGEYDRIAYNLEPWWAGWEALQLDWNGRGAMIVARPRSGVEL